MRALLVFSLLLVTGLAVLVLRPFDQAVDPRGVRRPVIDRQSPQTAEPPLRPVAPRAGAPLSYTLVEQPADRYAEPRQGEGAMARLVAGAGAEYDRALGQAARELANFYAHQGALLPTAALGFLLDAGGASAWGVRQAVVVTSATGDAALTDAITEHLSESNFAWQVGLGEAERDGQRVIAVLLAHRTHLLSPVARRWSVGERVPLRGRLLAGATDAQWVVMRPDLSVFDLPVKTANRFDVDLPLDAPGEWIAELVATGPHGPTPLTQLTFYVDAPLPTQLETVWPPDEAQLTGAAAVDRAAALLAADRSRFGLPPLERVAALDAVAQAHSDDMQRNDFVGHVSKSTGGPGDRIKAAGFKAAMSGENVALNRSLWDAEAGLLRSLGHRRNILSRRFTQVGFGVARRGPNWYVTQLFATPPPVIDDIPAARKALRDQLNAARKIARAPRLRVRKALRRIAQREAKRRSPTPRHALDRAAKAKITGKVSAWVGKMSTLDQFEPEGGLLSKEFTRMGMGVHQTDDDEIRVVILLAR